MNLRAITYTIITMVLPWGALLTSTKAEAETAVAARLTAQNKIDLKRVENYLESLSTLKSGFLQISSNGGVASGKFFMSRPGKLRFEYDPPASILIISDGIFLIYIDKDLDQVTHVFLKSIQSDARQGLGNEDRPSRARQGSNTAMVTTRQRTYMVRDAAAETMQWRST